MLGMGAPARTPCGCSATSVVKLWVKVVAFAISQEAWTRKQTTTDKALADPPAMMPGNSSTPSKPCSKQQDALMAQTKESLMLVGKQAGMSEQAVEACEKDQAMLEKLSADQKFDYEVLKVDATPTFFVNGEKLRGSMSFEELDKKIKSLSKK
jgi:Thioredoxin